MASLRLPYILLACIFLAWATVLTAPRIRPGRIVSALAATTASVPVVITAFLAYLQFRHVGGHRFAWSTALREGLGFSTYAMAIAGPVALFAGVCAHRLFAYLQWNRFWHYAVAGVALGSAPFILFDVWVLLNAPHPAYELRDWWSGFPWISLGATCGAAAASAFWTMTVRTATVW